MKDKKTIFYVAFLFSIGILSSYGQESMNSSGGNANGANGSSTFTIGQPFYISSFSTEGSTAPGVQQPFEIWDTLSVDGYEINLSAKAYPNPTTDIVYITVGDTNLSKLTYQLYDSSGRLLSNGEVNNNETPITMANYQKAIYLLNIIHDNNVVKTFKILKH